MNANEDLFTKNEQRTIFLVCAYNVIDFLTIGFSYKRKSKKFRFFENGIQYLLVKYYDDKLQYLLEVIIAYLNTKQPLKIFVEV